MAGAGARGTGRVSHRKGQRPRRCNRSFQEKR
jgi:hypothetical protein